MTIKRVQLKGIKIAEAVIQAITKHCEDTGLDASLEIEAVLAKHFDVLLIDDPEVLRILEEKDLKISSLNAEVNQIKTEADREIARLKALLANAGKLATEIHGKGTRVLNGPADAVGFLIESVPEVDVTNVAVIDESAITDEDEGEDDDFLGDPEGDGLFEDEIEVEQPTNDFPLDDDEEIVEDDEEIPSIPPPAATGKVQLTNPALLAAHAAKARSRAVK